jgi:hypothetical protein
MFGPEIAYSNIPTQSGTLDLTIHFRQNFTFLFYHSTVSHSTIFPNIKHKFASAQRINLKVDQALY